jgi:hypothetical protein
MATLHLEYTCTGAEMEEAQSLSLRKHIGRGSKWLTRLVLFGLLLLMLVGFYFQTQREVSPVFRPYMYAGVFVVSIIVFLWQRRIRNRPRVSSRVEVTTADFTVLTGDSKVTVPWSAFSDCLESPNLFVLLDRPKGMLFIVPKRAFPDENWQNWFRTQANNRPPPDLLSQTAAPVTTLSGASDQIRLNFRLGYRDYLGYTLATWRTWGMIIFFEGIFLGATLYAAVHPAPGAVNSSARIFFMFEFPFQVVLMVMMIFLFSLLTWRAHTKYLVPQDMVLTKETIHIASRDGTGIIPWTAYGCYKETRRSFILWKPRESGWLMLPKRAFASADDMQRCRALLAGHLRRSRWFFG